MANWKDEELGRRRREDLLSAVERFTEEHGYSPTDPELAQMLGISRSAVQNHIRILMKEGRLERPSGTRSLRIRY